MANNDSFKTPDPSKPASIFGGSQKTLFGGSSSTSSPATAPKEEEKEKKETPTTVFGSSFTKGIGTSGGFASLAGKSTIFEQKGNDGDERFAALAKSKLFGTVAPTKQDKAKNDENEETNENPGEYEPDVQLAPVIPQPDVVDVRTGEEDEEVKYSQRSKIYRFVKESSEYKERGVGDIKLLYNPKTKKYRVVMRHDQVHKICANFAVLPSLKLLDRTQQLNARNIVVLGCSENTTEGIIETLAIKFKTAEMADQFEEAFKAAQKDLEESSA